MTNPFGITADDAFEGSGVIIDFWPAAAREDGIALEQLVAAL
jgi:hypothetical protein